MRVQNWSKPSLTEKHSGMNVILSQNELLKCSIYKLFLWLMTYTHHIEVCLREPILTPTPVTTRSSYSTSNEQPTLHRFSVNQLVSIFFLRLIIVLLAVIIGCNLHPGQWSNLGLESWDSEGMEAGIGEAVWFLKLETWMLEIFRFFF